MQQTMKTQMLIRLKKDQNGWKQTGVDLVKNNKYELRNSNVDKSGNAEITGWKEKKSKQEFGFSLKPMKIYNSSFFRNCEWRINKELTATLQMRATCWNRALWVKMRWWNVTVDRQGVCFAWHTPWQTENENRGSLYCARDAFTETSVISVTHCGSHAQPADAVTLQKQAPVERYERRVRGKMVMLLPSQQVPSGGGRQLCIVCRC